MAAVEAVLGGEGEIPSQEIGQGRGVEPMPMEAPFAPRIDEAVGNQDGEDRLPVGALLRGAQAGHPEGIELELAPELQGEAAGTPLAWATDRDRIQADGNAVLPGVIGQGTIVRLEGQRALGGVPLVEDGDGLFPGGEPGIVDLAQI